MEIREYDIVMENRTGIRWVVVSVLSRIGKVVITRRGDHGPVHGVLSLDEIEVVR